MSALSKYLPSLPPAPPVVLARADAFFTRRVPLAPGEPVGPQVSLALEGMAPFPPEQLYYGHLTGADGQSALVFAAFRRRFSAEETEAWDSAAMVTPEFVPLLPTRPSGDGLTLHVGAARVTALAWKAGADLPAAVVVRVGGSEISESLLDEARSRAELPLYAEVIRIEGEPLLVAAGEGAFESRVGEASHGALPESWSTSMDVRDPEFLNERRLAAVRDLWLWRGLLGAAAVLVFSATLHIGSGVLGLLTRSRENLIATQKPVVEQISAAQLLANRIGELSEKRLMPFEMMALINPPRPESVVFQRAVTRGLLGLEVEAQAANAEDVGAYENALRALPALASVSTRDVRARDGVTSFVITIEFKSAALRNGGVL
ncbi:MAG: hypothetical protein H7067_12285 [Burkholderiales bacterium]|nr:hypothetical protein [Opitutaceae bacterium]